MLETIRFKYGFDDAEVLGVLQLIPREGFVPKKYKKMACNDEPVHIGFGQTISQPYTVAIMTHLATEITNSHRASGSQEPVAKLQIPNKFQITNPQLGKMKRNTISRVLEIGTGSGYQAAVLSYFFDRVFTVEIIPELAEKACKTLKKLGYKNVNIKTDSGERGWKQKAPFDAIMITAGVEKVPEELFNQLKTGGVLVAPVGKDRDKIMTRYTKNNSRGKEVLKTEKFGKFSFVPFVKLSSFENLS